MNPDNVLRVRPWRPDADDWAPDIYIHRWTVSWSFVAVEQCCDDPTCDAYVVFHPDCGLGNYYQPIDFEPYYRRIGRG